MISRELAEKLIERITKYTDYNVNIMDENGIIIASRDLKRVGQYHEIAHRIVRGPEDVIELKASEDFPNVKPGINMVISESGHREGVVGVTGDPEIIRPVAMITKMAIETILKYERQQEAARLRENRKERFVYMLTQDPDSDPDELREIAESLGYPEEMPRIPILVYSDTVDPDEAVRLMRNSAGHQATDFSIVLDMHHFVIFKTVASSGALRFSEYRTFILDYLDPFFAWLEQNKKTAVFCVGTIQQSYPQYYYSFRHCRWLENNKKALKDKAVSVSGGEAWAHQTVLFFYEHAGSYLQDLIPTGELQHIFFGFLNQLPEKKLRLYMEMTGALLKHNFNFGKAAEELYVHKNTLVYRYNAMKAFFGIDPLESAADRSFLGSFYQYYGRISD